MTPLRSIPAITHCTKLGLTQCTPTIDGSDVSHVKWNGTKEQFR